MGAEARYIVATWLLLILTGCASGETRVQITRLLDRPIIDAGSHPSIGENIQGPSLIRVPDWVDGPLGRYYLYFADHKGSYIRLAYADELTGPWRIHASGSLQLAKSHFPTEAPQASLGQIEVVRARYLDAGIDLDALELDPIQEMSAPHIASPDVHVDHEGRRIVMYFHGLRGFGDQVTRVAKSVDGIHFEALPGVLGQTYWRAFRYDDDVYAMAMPGQFYRAEDWLEPFEKGPLLFNKNMRHAAMLLRGSKLYVFWTQVGDAPERILLSTVNLAGDWQQWVASPAVELLRPERDWEGARSPIVASVRSVAPKGANQLRDPAIYEEDGQVYLLYSVGGESGIAIARVIIEVQQRIER